MEKKMETTIVYILELYRRCIIVCLTALLKWRCAEVFPAQICQQILAGSKW